MLTQGVESHTFLSERVQASDGTQQDYRRLCFCGAPFEIPRNSMHPKRIQTRKPWVPSDEPRHGASGAWRGGMGEISCKLSHLSENEQRS